MVNCPKCGSYNPTGSNFCSKCGSEMNTNSNKSKVRKIKIESHDPKKPIGGVVTHEKSTDGNTLNYIGRIICVILILVCIYLFLRGLWANFISLIIYGPTSIRGDWNPIREMFFMIVGLIGVPILLVILAELSDSSEEE